MKQFLNSRVTLYLPNDEGGFSKRTIPSVMVKSTETLNGGITTDIYVPLHFKRGIKYVSPDRFEHKKTNLFTVIIGQLLVIGDSDSEIPPDDALTLLSVSLKTVGSRRLHHLKLRAVSKVPMEDIYYE